jgi:hypothetical protein
LRPKRGWRYMDHPHVSGEQRSAGRDVSGKCFLSAWAVSTNISPSSSSLSECPPVDVDQQRSYKWDASAVTWGVVLGPPFTIRQRILCALSVVKRYFHD